MSVPAVSGPHPPGTPYTTPQLSRLAAAASGYRCTNRRAASWLVLTPSFFRTRLRWDSTVCSESASRRAICLAVNRLK
jgi:hypothetical protein